MFGKNILIGTLFSQNAVFLLVFKVLTMKNKLNVRFINILTSTMSKGLMVLAAIITIFVTSCQKDIVPQPTTDSTAKNDGKSKSSGKVNTTAEALSYAKGGCNSNIYVEDGMLVLVVSNNSNQL